MLLQPVNYTGYTPDKENTEFKRQKYGIRNLKELTRKKTRLREEENILIPVPVLCFVY